MKMIKNLFKLVSVIAFSVALTGCWESADITLHEPGVYQGASDNLSSDTAALQARFKGQTDR